MEISDWEKNILLKNYCTLGIGGPARYFFTVRTVEELCSVLVLCRKENIPYFILGKGSNCLFDDRGFDGLVILNKVDFNEAHSSGRIHVGAGYSFSLLGVNTARGGWSGLEFASGIPGSVGGAIFMNAGANGGQASDCLVSVDYVDEHGKLQTLTKDKIKFAYRSSSFQTMPGAIAGATFHLQPSEEARKYQLSIIAYRMKTQPYKNKSAGCVFRNPQEGHAGALIEKAGLKGFSIRGAQVSTMHSNFLINLHEATAQDMLHLIEKVKEEIKLKYEQDLELEIRIIPYQIHQNRSTRNEPDNV